MQEDKIEDKTEKKIDKIFDNKFGERNFEGGYMNFKIDSIYISTGDMEDQIHFKLLLDSIHSLISESEFKKLNESDDNGDKPKLNKVQINKVYGFIVGKLSGGYRRIEIWSILSEYFDIYPAKFYSSLSNVYKHELITELDKTQHVLEKKNIKKLY